MARNAKSARTRRKSQAAAKAAADATGGALGFAMHAVQGSDPSQKAQELSSLAQLCDQAADHMALAHNLLVTHVDHTDTAIDHLDAALGCLKQIMSQGKEGKGAKPAKNPRQVKSA